LSSSGSDGDAGVRFGSLTLDAFLERVASREPAPGGGVVAAVAVAGAAGLAAMAARFSDQLAGAADLAKQADALRARADQLADDDARAYGAVLAAYRRDDEDAESRRNAIREALSQATDVPLALVACAREVGQVAMTLADTGNPNLRGDAVTAVLLADAAARSATYLVRCNVRLGGLDDDRLERAERCCHELAAAVRAVQS